MWGQSSIFRVSEFWRAIRAMIRPKGSLRTSGRQKCSHADGNKEGVQLAAKLLQQTQEVYDALVNIHDGRNTFYDRRQNREK